MPKFKNHSNYNCKVTLDTGEQFLVYGQWIHNQKLDHWQGWQCDAGLKKFYIDKNFDIWDGLCQNKILGNIFDDWNVLNNNICQKETCVGCTDDLIATKFQI